MNKKIVLIAYHSDSDSSDKAIAHVQSALAHLDSSTIRERFEIFDVVDSNK